MKIAGFGGQLRPEGGAVAATIPTSVAAPRKQENKTEPPYSFKLKMAMAETKEDLRTRENEETTQADSGRVKAQSEFTQPDVSKALEAYIGTLQEDTAVKIALTSHAPKVEGFVISLQVDNDFLLAKVMDMHPSLSSFLMKKLNNGFITLNVQVFMEADSGQDKKRLFTAKDKFEHFIELNPAVGELKALFGLEIE